MSTKTQFRTVTVEKQNLLRHMSIAINVIFSTMSEIKQHDNMNVVFDRALTAVAAHAVTPDEQLVFTLAFGQMQGGMGKGSIFEPSISDQVLHAVTDRAEKNLGREVFTVADLETIANISETLVK